MKHLLVGLALATLFPVARLHADPVKKAQAHAKIQELMQIMEDDPERLAVEQAAENLLRAGVTGQARPYAAYAEAQQAFQAKHGAGLREAEALFMQAFPEFVEETEDGGKRLVHGTLSSLFHPFKAWTGDKFDGQQTHWERGDYMKSLEHNERFLHMEIRKNCPFPRLGGGGTGGFGGFSEN